MHRTPALRNCFERRRLGALGLANVPQNTVGVVERFGRFHRLMQPGLNAYVPFVDRVRSLSLQQTELDFPLTVKTSDNAFVTMQVAAQVQVLPGAEVAAVYHLADPAQQIRSYIDATLRAHGPKHTLDELFGQRDEINAAIAEAVGAAMRDSGYQILRTQVLDIEPAAEVTRALNAVLASKRDLEAARNRAEARKAELVKGAEADAERLVLNGKGLAGQRIEVMRGYEEGVAEMARNLGVTPSQIMDFLLRSQQIDAWQRIGEGTNTKVLFLPPADRDDRMAAFLRAQEAGSE